MRRNHLRSSRLRFISLELRDLPSAGFSLPNQAPYDVAIAAANLNADAIGLSPIDSPSHGGGCGCGFCRAIPFNPALVIGGPEQKPTPAGPQIANFSPGGGPDGPISPMPFSYTTTAAGLPILTSSTTSPTHIYLDFDGEGSMTPYDTDGAPGTFSVTEQKVIVECWRQMSVYYAVFDMNVTTVKPLASAAYAWHLSSNSVSGGYSYVNVFPNSEPESFNQSGDANSRVSGIAHEIGHNMGLSHQSDYDSLGNKVNEYSSGFALHGPLMGVDYAQSVHKFIIGHPSSSPSTLQDDMAILANKIRPYQPVGGDGYRPDDHGNTTATGTTLVVDEGYYGGWGTIERLTDLDAFNFTTAGGAFSFAVWANRPSALDAKLEIFDSTGNRLATLDSTNNDQYAVVNIPAGTNTMVVSSHGDYADSGSYFVTARPLSNGWTTSDIGTVAMTGYAGVDLATGVWRVGGSGADIWGSTDGFRFAYTPLTGDGSITARVTGVEATNAAAKVGAMIRETLANNSRNAFMAVRTTDTGFQVRSANGGSTTEALVAGAAPRWVRMARTGNLLTGQYSADGVTWTTLGTTTLSGLASTVYIGLAVTSHTTSVLLNDATFDNVSTTGTTGPATPVYNALAAPTGLVPTLGATTGIVLNWAQVVGATGYAIDRSPEGVTWTQIATTSGVGATTYTNTGLSGGLRYFYRVAARDAAATRSPNSTVVSIVNRPGAVTNFSTTSWTTSSIILNWRDISGESGYRVERSTDSGTTWTAISTLGKNIPSYTNSGLASSTAYQYRIISLGADADGDTSGVLTESTRLAAVTGASFTAVATNRVGIQWNPVNGATGVRVERSTDNTTFTTLATIPTLNYVDTTVSAQTEYYYRLTAVNGNSESITKVTILTATPALTIPPVPWVNQDVGTVGGAGTTSYGGTTFTLLASGVGVTGTADSLRFSNQLLVGDGAITARVNTLEAGTGATAGVMIRESTASNSRVVFVAVTPTNGITLSSRTSTGGQATTNATVASVVAPYWVRINRTGTSFTGFTSTDGVTWTQIGSALTVAMATNVRAGLAEAGGANSNLNSATFTNVTLTQGDIAPSVFSSTPTGLINGPANSVDLTFTEVMDTTSFSTTSDLASFTGPGGNLLGFISGFSWISTSTLRVTFNAFVAKGDYSLIFHPTILSTTGQPLDQDRDNVLGEATEDRYTATFRIGSVVADTVGYVYTATSFDSTLNLNPSAPGVTAVTGLSSADDASLAIDLASNFFRFHNVDHSGSATVFVSSNGHITFGASDTSGQNGNLTAPSSRTIAPLWDNLETNANTATDDVVLYQLQDTNGDALPDRLVINWRNVHYFSHSPPSDDGITFQAVLELNTGSRNGEITFNYTDLDESGVGATNNAGGATVGIKGTGTTTAPRVVISQNSNTSATVATGKAVKVFVDRSPSAVAGGPYTLTANGTVPLSALGSSDPEQSTVSLTYIWDLDGDGVFGETGAIAIRGDETGATPTFKGQGLVGASNYTAKLRVIDDFGKSADASTTIAIPAPPRVLTSVVNDGTPQRSRVERLTLTFDNVVNLPLITISAFTLVGPGGPVAFSVDTTMSTGTQTIAQINFAALPDGRYTLTALAGSITDSIGQTLDGDANGLAGDNLAVEFHRLYGDIDGDADVDNTDFAAFRLGFGTANTAFDYDNDGDVDNADLAEFRVRFGTMI